MNHIKERMQLFYWELHLHLYALFLHIKRPYNLSLHSPNQLMNMTNLRMSCLFSTIMVLSITLLNCCSATKHDLIKSSSTIVVGSVYCDTCSHHSFSKSSHFISGAMVAVECRAGGLNQNFTRVSQTNENGEFKMHLPFSPKRNSKRINHCSVKLIHSGDPNCTVPSASGSSAGSLVLIKSRENGVRIFSAGAFSFKPLNLNLNLNLPNSCSQKKKKKKKKAEENFINSVNYQKESVNPVPNLPVISSPPSTASGIGIRPQSPDLFPSIPSQPTAPPLISLNIPPLLNLPPLMNIPIPLPSFKPVPGFGFPGIPSASSSPKENSP